MTFASVDLRLLRVFAMVVERGGFTQAAAALNVGRSTISTHMADLETRLGVRLCERGRSGFALTHQGEHVYERAQRLFTAMEDFDADMQALHGKLTGELNLGFIDYMTSLPQFQYAEVFRRFTDQAPDVTLNVQVLSEQDVVRTMLDGGLHGGIISDVPKIVGLDYAPLFHETLYLYVSKEHPLFDRDDETITEDEIVAAPIAGWLYELHEAARHPLTHAKADNLEAILMLIMSGRYTGYLLDHFAAPWAARGEIRPLKPDLTQQQNNLMIVTRSGAPTTPPLDMFLKILRDVHMEVE